MYININKKYLSENRRQMEKSSIQMSGDEGKDSLLIEETEGKESVEVEDGCLNVMSDSEFGFASIFVPITDDLAFAIVDHLKEKGKKIQKLINLEN